ncbi:S-adenosylmethionine-dependent methyltransferase Rv2258c-like isoform X2 [Apostichopus japonicus]|uniref:S-adenosylmethionine-dependent methyltransferase Rv2258c-like isoform X2 n=2 Tax=Stichopus japonicus TaxID=307972 RepID=UPI003AB50A39
MQMASKGETDLSEDFGPQMTEIIQHGCASVMIAMGYDLGLFDVMAELSGPNSSEEIAAAAGMKERYIREWLGVMVTAKVVSIDATGNKFFLPANRVPYLTKGVSGMMAHEASFMVNLTKNAFDKVKASFLEAGPTGTSYDDYPGKFELTAKFGEHWMKNHLASSFIPLFPELKTQLESGIKVIDLGCGMGVSTCALAKAFPKSTIHGVDFVDINFQGAKKQAKEESLKNCKFSAGDISNLPDDWSGHFQYAFMNNVFHDLAHPMTCLAEIKRILGPGGLLSIIDCHGYSAIKDNIDRVPAAVNLYSASLLACLPLSLGAGGVGLGAMCGVEKIKEVVTSAGFEMLQSGVAPECRSYKHYFHCKVA